MHISPISVLFLGVLVLTASPADGFTAQSSSRQPGVGFATFHRMATIEEQAHMTKEDEDVLFGKSSEEPHPELRSQHRTKDVYGNVLRDVGHAPNPLDHAKDPLINKLSTMRSVLDSCPQIWLELAKHCPEKRALFDEHMCDEKIEVTFGEMSTLVQKSAAIFAELGVKKGVHVAILGENSARWLMIDHGIQLAGGASAVRGADAPLDELRYIYEHSDSASIAVLQGPRLLQKLAKDAKAKGLPALGLSNKKYGNVKTIVLINREKSSADDVAKMAAELGLKIVTFSDMLDDVEPLDTARRPKLGRSDLATIVYTSGTTGSPKGVMLTHGNLLHQTQHRLSPSKPFEEDEPLPDDVMVSILPVWHITERAFEIWMASHGCSVVYSSIRTFKNDLAKHRPHWMVLVPRVLEKTATGIQDKFAKGSPAVKVLSKFFTSVSQASAKHRKIVAGLVVADEPPSALKKLLSKAILTALAPLNAVGTKLVWSKIQNGFGGRVKTIISGGSALAGSLETFYETAGINVLVGYGLTECSPLLSFRNRDTNLVYAGCAGKACVDTEVRVVDPASKAVDASRSSLPIGEIGVVIGRGPQVMKGYYKNKEATEKAVDKFGWFDTGDLGRINPATGDLILTGRVKDTIVLSNGENIEPIPIEDAILGATPLIEQVMLTGQDGRRLVAIAVLHPKELAAEGYLKEDEAKSLQDANDKVNDPKCTEEECQKVCKLLNEASAKLRANADLKQTLMTAIQKGTSGFRKWEQVGEVYMTLEPFAMANGQLTQSYKVKRASVMERYENELPK
jgi:long-chain acyl-CoA synthetase